jgi:hypothetical protein
MNQEDPITTNMQTVILLQSKRLNELEDKLIFWRLFGIGMTAACIIIAALKCQH